MPTLLKVIPALAMVYLLWPRDVVPDFVPWLGRLDDLLFLLLGMSSYLRLSAPWTLPRKDAASGSVVEGTYQVVKTEQRD